MALDKSDSVYFGCDAGCLNPPVSLSQSYASIPVKLTKPLTAILYITSDYQHMQDLRNALHVHAIDDGWYIYINNLLLSFLLILFQIVHSFISYLMKISRMNPQRNLIHFSFVFLTKSFPFNRICICTFETKTSTYDTIINRLSFFRHINRKIDVKNKHSIIQLFFLFYILYIQLLFNYILYIQIIYSIARFIIRISNITSGEKYYL